MEHFIVECRQEAPFSKEEENAGAQAIDAYLEENQGRWLRSYYNQERTRLICEFEAPDEGTVRRAWELSHFPIDSLWQAEVFSREGLLESRP